MLKPTYKESINFPESYTYSSDSEKIPLEFYEQVVPVSKNIDLLLGYFSTSAIQFLSRSFAEFIYNGGSMRLITNEFLKKEDYDNLIDYLPSDYNQKIISSFSNLEELQKSLSKESQHFFDCLRFLKEQNRLNLKPVKFNKNNLSHQKVMLFNNGEETLLTSGSFNFTLSALTKNSEQFNVEAPWNGDLAIKRIQESQNRFNAIFNDEHKDYRHIPPEEIEKIIYKVGHPKEIKDLLNDSLELDNSSFSSKVKNILEKKKERFNKKIIELRSKELEPHFPIIDGEIGVPREYQKEAYENWVKNNYQGIFAMATGTGKTITSLNCLLEEYKKKGFYKAFIFAPTQILVEQWVEECEKFNFQNIFSSYSKNWLDKLKSIKLNNKLGKDTNFIFITTYANYNSHKFQNFIKNYKDENTIIIADEVHNLGTKRSINNYIQGISKKIGLSATPNRNFDEEGTLEIEKYFNSYGPSFTYSYSMLRAIESGFLTPYFYFPKFVSLNNDEIEEYSKISEKLIKFFDFEKGRYKDEASNLLIQRKRIIHQAKNKKYVLVEILKNIGVDNISNTIVYVPEGFEPDYSDSESYNVDEEDVRIINDYTKTINKMGIETYQIVGGMNKQNRNKVLDQFNRGIIKVLTAMKTLDEGVDIPSTKSAIFCSSTGNPRQYIQRRGRILRKFEGKKYATVYDLIIRPNDMSIWANFPRDKREKLHNLEINIFRGEIERVANFLYAAENVNDIHLNNNKDITELIEMTNQYNIDIYSKINELTEIDKV